MTDEERTRAFGMIQQYGPQAFLNAYSRTHPRQSDRIKSLMDRRGAQAVARMLFGFTSTPSRRTPGPPPQVTAPPGATGLGATPSITGDVPSQGVGGTPSQRGGVGTGLTAQPGLLAGATEVVARDLLGPRTPPAVQVAPAIPRIEEPGQILPAGELAEDRTTGLAPEASLITGMEAIAEKTPTIDATTDVYALFDKFSTLAKESSVPFPVLMGMIKQESNFDPGAKSGAGAVGLLQLMQATAIDRGLSVTAEFDERSDPVRNVEAGLEQMKWLRDNYSPGNLKSWLAAYNAGHTRLKDDKWKEMKEPRDYAKNVARYAEQYMKSPQLLATDFIKMYANIRKATRP